MVTLENKILIVIVNFMHIKAANIILAISFKVKKCVLYKNFFFEIKMVAF